MVCRKSHRQPTFIVLMGVLCVVATTTFAVAPEPTTDQPQGNAVVLTTHGRRLQGQIISDDPTGITLLIANIQTKIPRDQVQQVLYQLPIEQRYAHRRQQIPDDDIDSRYQLAYWLFTNNALDLAQQELDALIQVEPNDARIERLSQLVRARRQLQDQAPATGHPVTPRGSDSGVTTTPASSVGAAAPTPLTPAQIGMIKVYEIDLSTKPKVLVPPRVLEQVFEDYANQAPVPPTRAEQVAFRRQPGYKKLNLLFKLRARELYPQVKVVSDPPSINRFRTQFHQRYVLNYCGSIRCHGNTDAGRFVLLRRAPNSEPTVYTNFFVLHKTADGQHEMIDRQQPRASLLLQYGLPRQLSDTPHPEADGWQPHFKGDQDPLYQQIEGWIGMLWSPKPDYGIDDTLPPHRATTSSADSDTPPPVQPPATNPTP